MATMDNGASLQKEEQKQKNTAEPKCFIGPIESPTPLPIARTVINVFGDFAKRCTEIADLALRPYKKILGVVGLDMFLGFLDGDKPDVLLIEMSNTNPGMLAYAPKTLLDITLHRKENPVYPEDLSTPHYHIGNALGRACQVRWKGRPTDEKPVIGIFSTSPFQTMFSWDHSTLLRMLREAGFEAYPVYPESKYEVKKGRFSLELENKKVEIDVGILRFSTLEEASKQFHIPYQSMMNWDITWLNDPQSFKLRSKVKVEEDLRLIEEVAEKKIPRPQTLIGGEITSRNLQDIFHRYKGVVTKPSEGSGGTGVITYVNSEITSSVWSQLYLNDFFIRGKGIVRVTPEEFETLSRVIGSTSSFVSGMIKPDYVVEEGVPHIYDLRLYAVFDGEKYRIINGLSRLAPTRHRNLSIITNVTNFIKSGSSLAPLFFYPERTEGLEYTGVFAKKFFT